MKIAINTCYGGFGISIEALQLYYKLKYNKETYVLQKVGDYPNYTFEPTSDSTSYWNKYVFTTPNPIVPESDEEFCSCYDIERNDPILIEVIEKLGEKADGQHAKLKIVEIPDDVEWQIGEYDGIEWVEEQHRRWS